MKLRKVLVNFSITVCICIAIPCISQAEVGITDTEIHIGSSLPLEGHASYLGIQTMHGAMAYIKHINESGGVHNRKIKFTTYNDSYDPDSCEKNTNKLINEDKVFALSCYVGTPTSAKVVPIIEKAGVPLVGVFTGAEFLREPVKKYIFNIRSSYFNETEGIIDHFWNELGLRKIAVFYQNDAFGKAGLKGVEMALQKYQSKPVALGSYERGSNNITAALATIRNSSPEAVVMISTYGPSSSFIQSAKWSGFSPYFSNLSVVGAKELVKILGVGRDSKGVIVTQVVPTPDSSFPGVQEYHEYLKKYYPEDEPNFVSLEGFVNAKVLVEIIKQAGPEITREGFIQAAESLKDFDTQCDSKITYSPTDHRGIEKIYYTIFDKKKYTPIENWSEVKPY